MAPSVQRVTFFGWVGGPKYPPPAIKNEQRKKSEKVWFRGFLYTSFLPKISAPLKYPPPPYCKKTYLRDEERHLARGGGEQIQTSRERVVKHFGQPVKEGGAKNVGLPVTGRHLEF